MLTALNTELLAQSVEVVFTTMMELEITPAETPWAPCPEHLTSVIHLLGIWNGTLLFECDRRQACQFAGLMLSMEPPATVDDVVRDALGELANMIGGNLKSALECDLSLSLPSVTDGNDYEMRVGASGIRDRLAFECSHGPFWVTLLAEGPDIPDTC